MPVAASAARPAESVHASVQHHDFKAQHIITGHAVTKTMSTPCVHRDVTAQRTHGATGRIGRIKQIVRAQSFIQLTECHTAFDFTPESLKADRANFLQRRRVNHDTALRCHRSSGK